LWKRVSLPSIIDIMKIQRFAHLFSLLLLIGLLHMTAGAQFIRSPSSSDMRVRMEADARARAAAAAQARAQTQEEQAR